MRLYNRAKLWGIKAGALKVGFGTLEPVASYLEIKCIVKSSSILASVIIKEVVRIEANFLAGWDICLHNNTFYYNYSIWQC